MTLGPRPATVSECDGEAETGTAAGPSPMDAAESDRARDCKSGPSGSPKNLMRHVRVPTGEGLRPFGRLEDLLLAAVLQYQVSALVRRRQADYKRAEHARNLLRAVVIVRPAICKAEP